MTLRSQVASGPTRSHKRRTYRQTNRHPHSHSNHSDVPNHEEDTHMEGRAVLGRHAADECVDQPHIYSDPAWKAFGLCPSSERSTGSASGNVLDDLDSEGNLQLAGALGSYEYKEQHSIVFFKLCPKEKRWLDLGPAIAIIEGGVYASAVTVRMERTFRVLATWSIFGGMKVIRFLSTVIVLAIVPDDEGTQRVVSYGLKLATLEEAKGLAILLSSTTRGLQMNMERLVPRTSAAKRAKILEIMADRLKVLKQRLGEKEESELSAKVESELAAMLSVGTELTE